MPKTISVELKAHLQGGVTTLASCWKVTRKDAVVLGFTNHDVDVVFDGVIYLSDSGFQPEDLRVSSKIGQDKTAVLGLLDSSAIAEPDVMAGRYDHAEIEIFLLNYEDLTQGKLILRTGWLGEVTLQGGQYSADINGLSQRLQNTIGSLYSPLCRADLGDAKCGVNLASVTVTGTLTGVSSQQVFGDSSRAESAGHFAYGVILFTSGNNVGVSMEVKEFSVGGDITTMLPLPDVVQIGDAYSLSAGCDKIFSTCRNRFSNVVNFRGEPHIPGLDRLFETSVTRQK